MALEINIMAKRSRNFQSNNISSKNDSDKKSENESLWGKTIKFWIVDVPAMMFMGIIVGILISYAFMSSKPELFIHPLISAAVQATLTAQPTVTILSTPTILSNTPASSTPQVQFINSCDDYGIKITSPVSGDKFPRNGTLHGTYTKKPENAEVWIFSIYREKKHVDYRPRNIAILQDDGSWISETSYIGEIGNETELAPFIVGKDARILINYHNMVGAAIKQWFAITELPSDLVPCSSSAIVEITPPN